MAKWIFYLLVFVYMCYRAAYGARVIDTNIAVDQIHYEEEAFLRVGTRKTVNCRAHSKNQRLEWVDPFGNVVKRIPSSRVYAQEHFISIPKGNRSPGLVLTFSELEVSDSGLYTCKSGDQKKTVRVCVIKPSEFVDSDDTPSEVTIEAGRSITLACQANGDPEPTLVWVRHDEELEEGIEHPKYKVNRRYKIEGYESLLTITDVEPYDAGLYQCVSVQESPMLENCTATDVRNVTLLVNHKPVFRTGERTQYVFGTNNEVVDIKCETEGWPIPSFRWFKDLGGDSLYEFNKSKIVLSDDLHTAVLPVTAGPTTYGNIYKCTATNKFGSTEKSFRLLRREKPMKADHVEPALITGSSIYLNVSWEATFFPIDSFSIQYIPSSEVSSRIPSRSDWKKADQVEKEVLDDDSIDLDIVVKLDNLEPETEYFVRIKAVNEAGEAPWSEVINVSTNDEEEIDDEAGRPEEPEEESETGPEFNSDNGMFYGVFFTGAIMLCAILCMFAMRLV